jgi:hypothetical protein
VREFSTFIVDIEAMKEWWCGPACTHVVMVSAGSYWRAVFNVLAGSLVVCLANCEDVKGCKGHKAVRKDAKWLARLLRHDHPGKLLSSSGHPGATIHEAQQTATGAMPRREDRVQKRAEDTRTRDKLGACPRNTVR